MSRPTARKSKMKPHPPGAVLKTLREFRSLEQADLALLVGVATKTISDYERGAIRIGRVRVEELAKRMGCPPEAVDLAFGLHATLAGDGLPDWPIPMPPGATAALLRLAAGAANAVRETLIQQALAARAGVERERALDVWGRLEPLATADRKLALERTPGLATWALAELLVARSLEAAPERHRLALVLGELAVDVCKLEQEVAPALRDRVAAHAWAAVGNARRVAGWLPEADRAFATVRALWPIGTLCPGNLLSEARLFDLEASLRRDQRQFDRAHQALDHAIALTPPGAGRGRLLLQLASIHEQAGSFEKSIRAVESGLREFGQICPPIFRCWPKSS